MIKLTEDRKQDILGYMEDDLANCLYLYGDIVRYGLDDPNMTVWFSETDGKVTAVLMKYFTGAQLYSKKQDYDLNELVSKIREIDPDRLSTQKSIAKELEPFFEGEYLSEYGDIIKFEKFRKMRSPFPIEQATNQDVDEITDLLFSHELFSSSYDKDALRSELADRIGRNIGRSFVMRKDGQIIGHTSFSIETDKFAVSGLTLVHDDYRDTFYGLFLETYCHILASDEGKQVYGMILEKRRVEGFLKMGNSIAAEYGKLFKKNI